VWTEEKFQDFVIDMEGDNLNSKSVWLRILAQVPSGDARVLPYLQEKVQDTTMCLLGIPIEYGELRWMAAHALAAEYSVQGILTPVILRQVPQPIDANTFARLSIENQLKEPGEGKLIVRHMALMDDLRRLGKLPLEDLELNI
jgi:hypothetical protein